VALVFVFGFYAILDGVSAIMIGGRSRGEPYWGWLIVQGVVSAFTGVVALIWPGLTALALLFVVAFWAIMLGSARLAARSRPASGGRTPGAGR
jgi:uncharacterized membrane protein HdeD (DUF308 family)